MDDEPARMSSGCTQPDSIDADCRISSLDQVAKVTVSNASQSTFVVTASQRSSVLMIGRRCYQ